MKRSVKTAIMTKKKTVNMKKKAVVLIMLVIAMMSLSSKRIRTVMTVTSLLTTYLSACHCKWRFNAAQENKDCIRSIISEAWKAIFTQLHDNICFKMPE